MWMSNRLIINQYKILEYLCNFSSEVSNSYIKSANEAGYPSVDYNAHDQMGVSHIQYMLKNGQRMSANRAFLEQSRNRPNLDVITNSLATKIEIDSRKCTQQDYSGKNITYC